MTDSQKKKCHAIIHTASASATAIGAGLANLPFADSVPLTAIQLGMIISLGKVFGVRLEESAGKAILSDILGSQIGKIAAKTLAGMIPVAGNFINASIAGTITETIGWTAAKQFDRGE